MCACVRRRFAMIVTAALLAACESKTEPASFTLDVGSTMNVSQGQADTIPVTISRSHFTKAIHLSVTGGGATSGLLARISPDSLTGATTTTSLIVSASGTASPGSVQVTVQATGAGVASQSATVSVSVAVTGSYALTMADGTLRVAQGGGGATSVMINRIGGHADSVRMTVSGAPTGMDVTLEPHATVRNDASLLVLASQSTAPGTYTLTITGSAAGLTDQTTTLHVRVIAPPTTAPLTILFCPDGAPNWFAYQNDGFLWSHLVGAGSNFTFDATSRVAIAFVFSASGFTESVVYYATRNELAAINDRDCFGPKTIYGTTSAIGSGQTAYVGMGSAAAFASQASPNFSLDGVPDGAVDVITTRATTSSGDFIPDKMIIRRALTPASGDTLPTLDFSGTEAFALNNATVTITGTSTFDFIAAQNVFASTTSTYDLIQSNSGVSSPLTLYYVPPENIAAGDVHELALDAGPRTGVSGREIFSYFSTTGNRTEAFGPELSAASASVIATTPYVRMRGQFASQPEYGDFARFGFFQAPSPTDERYVIVGVSALYLGAAPSIWKITVPSFGSANGFNPNWMLTSGEHTDFFADAYSARTQLLFGDVPRDGERVSLAYIIDGTSTLRMYHARSGRSLRRPQYLRR